MPFSFEGVYQYFVHFQLNASATEDIATKVEYKSLLHILIMEHMSFSFQLNEYLIGRYILNNSANIMFVNIRYDEFEICMASTIQPGLAINLFLCDT